jgi:hypothetical protein
VISNQSGYQGNISVSSPPGSGRLSNGGTNNLIRQILSANQSATPSTTENQDGYLNIDGHFYRRVNSHIISYDVSRHETSPSFSSLMDGGANGGMTGCDVRVLSSSEFHKAHVTGIG